MGRKRANRFPGGFVIVPKAILGAPAWRSMSPAARLLWIELRHPLRHNLLYNGKRFRSCRDAAEAIGINKSTACEAIAENEHYGFLRKTRGGFLGIDGRGIAAAYRFTDLAYGSHPPTLDYQKWNGELFAYRSR